VSHDPQPASPWDHSVDVLVVGSGAGALTSALRAAQNHADVLVVEKSDLWGGSSAASGGGIWIPDSHLAQAYGVADSKDAAFGYVRALSADNVSDAAIRAFVDTGEVMLKWLEEATPVRYMSIPYTDYHAELPGGKPEGFRTHLPTPLDGRLLGEEVLTLRPASPAASLLGIINWDFTETKALLMRPKGWWKVLAKMVGRYALDLPHRFRSSKDRFLTLGNALLGGLRLACDEAGVEVWLKTPLKELVREDGRVVGVVIERDGKPFRIEARRGVILGAGGFEQNREMRAAHLRVKDPVRSGGQINNTGDAIRAGQAAGAAVKNMDSVWWAPVFSIPGEDRGRLSTIERALPGGIIVNQAGQRYMNEAMSYHMAGMSMAEADRPGAGTSPSYMVFDARFRHKYPVGPLLPLLPDALQPPAVRKTLAKAATLEALARQVGLPAKALKETVERFNTYARQGLDPDFHRGEAAYDRFYGDDRVTPNPSLAAIEIAPFYAFPIYPGDIGTNGGLATDERARVLDSQGQVIAGLYAIGNTAASVMGRSYPGAGSTLGPAMTFGYIAANDITGANAA
jgi:3-oxosteroid 1-dehydrogenase